MSIVSNIALTSRTLRTQAAYFKYIKRTKHNECAMCEMATPTKADDSHEGQVISRHTHFYVTHNIFPYTVWDGFPVESHLMIVPNRHVDSLAHLTETERLEWVQLVARYEEQDYSVLARSANNAAKSVIHQHTHLIKLASKSRRGLFLRRILLTK